MDFTDDHILEMAEILETFRLGKCIKTVQIFMDRHPKQDQKTVLAVLKRTLEEFPEFG